MSDDGITTLVHAVALLHASYDREEGTLYVRASVKVEPEEELYQPVAAILREHCHTEEVSELIPDRGMARHKAWRSVYQLRNVCPGASPSVRHSWRCEHRRQHEAKTPVKIAS